MSDDETSATPESDSDDFPTAYLASYRAHLAQTHAHLHGREDAPTSTESTDSDPHWSQEEKNLFFHALSIHSRLCPELIAEDIGTKGVVDVCAYLDALEDAASKAGMVTVRGEMEFAVEVGREWVGRERLAVDQRPKKRARKSDPEKLNLEEWEQKQARVHEKEDIMGRLKLEELKALDLISASRSVYTCVGSARRTAGRSPFLIWEGLTCINADARTAAAVAVWRRRRMR